MTAIPNTREFSLDPLRDLDVWWPSPIPDPVGQEDRDARRSLALAHCIVRVGNRPTEEAIEAAQQLRPDAASLLAWWREAWARSFPEDGLDWLRNEDDASCTPDGIVEGCRSTMTSAIAEGGATLQDLAMTHAVMTMTQDAQGWRDWRLHVLDDALTLRAMAMLQPDGGSILVGGRGYLFRGLDPDGYPIFKGHEAIPDGALRRYLRDAIQERSEEDDSRYWKLASFRRHAGRGFSTAADDVTAAYVLSAMARQGHRRAFLKGASSKSGTWTVPIVGCVEPVDAAASISRAMFPSRWPAGGVVVQEHTPFTHEQRFFVLSGRIVASVCSARPLCGLDATRRILDERVALIRTPEIEGGSYDRGVTLTVVDRSMSARFARAAKVAVTDLRSENVLDYVLDVGMTADGRVLPIEVNSLTMAGPYCLDRQRYVRAFSRIMTRTRSKFRRTTLALVNRLGTPTEKIQEVMSAVLPSSAREWDMHALLDMTAVEQQETDRTIEEWEEAHDPSSPRDAALWRADRERRSRIGRRILETSSPSELTRARVVGHDFTRMPAGWEAILEGLDPSVKPLASLPFRIEVADRQVAGHLVLLLKEAKPTKGGVRWNSLIPLALWHAGSSMTMSPVPYGGSTEEVDPVVEALMKGAFLRHDKEAENDVMRRLFLDADDVSGWIMMRGSPHSRRGTHHDAILDVVLLKDDVVLATSTIKVPDGVWDFTTEWRLAGSDGISVVDAMLV